MSPYLVFVSCIALTTHLQRALCFDTTSTSEEGAIQMAAPATEERDQLVVSEGKEDSVEAPTRHRAVSPRNGRKADAKSRRARPSSDHPRLVKASFNLPPE